MSAETWVRIFYGVLALAILYGVFRVVKEAVDQYRRGAIYDLEQKEKAAQDANHKLSDAELVDQANKALGLGPQPPTNSSDKKG